MPDTVELPNTNSCEWKHIIMVALLKAVARILFRGVFKHPKHPPKYGLGIAACIELAISVLMPFLIVTFSVDALRDIFYSSQSSNK